MNAPFHPMLPDRLAAGIGQLIAEWSAAQRMMVVLLHELVIERSTAPKEKVTAMAPLIGMDARPLISILLAMAKARLGKTDGDKFGKILDSIETIKAIRDACSHGLFSTTRKTGITRVTIVKTANSLQERHWSISPESLEASRLRLQTLVGELIGLLHSHGYAKAFRSSPETHT